MGKNVWIVVITLVIACCIAVFVTRNRPALDETVKIGVLLPLTGPSANHGQDALNAVRMKLAEIESSTASKIALIVEDSQSNPTRALNAFQKLTDIDNVSAIVGPISSSIVVGLGPLANKRQVPLVAIGSSSPKISEAGPYVYRHALLAETQSVVLARYAKEQLHADKVAFLYINDETGLGYVKRFREVYEQLGGMVVAEETFDRDSRDYRNQLTKLKQSGANVVFSPGIPSSTGYVLKQSAELGYPCTVLAGYGVEGQDIVTIAGDEGRRLIYTSLPYDQAFLTAYQQRYSKSATAGAGLAYDVMGLLAKGVFDGIRTSDGFKDFLDTSRGYVGATGILEFDKNGDTQKSPLIFKTVVGKDFVSVKDY